MLYLRADYANKCQCEFSVYITFRYNTTYLNLMKSLSMRAWHPDTKEWEIGQNSYNELMDAIKANNYSYNKVDFEESITDLNRRIAEANNPIKETKIQIDTSILDDVVFKTKPFDYQKEGIAYGLQTDCFLLADEQGLGKSLQASNIARLKRGGKHCLVIVGFDSLAPNWVNEIQTHTDENAYILGQRTSARGRSYIGTLQDRYNDLFRLDELQEFFLITTLTTLRQSMTVEYTDRNGKKRKSHDFYFAKKVNELGKDGRIGRIIFDEIQKCISYNAQGTQALLLTKDIPYKIAATGTPVMNNNIDLYPSMVWLGHENRNYWTFRDRYCRMGGFQNKQIIGNKNGDELNKKLSPYMLRRKKEDVLDLPEKLFVNELLDMDDTQERLYKNVLSFQRQQLIAMKKNKKEYNTELFGTQIKLRKITCNPKWYDEKYSGKSVKFDRCEDLMEIICQNDRKAIIFSNWATPIQWLYDILCKYNPAMIIGATTDRMVQVNKFQTEDSCRLILGTGGAMGTGLTLNAASEVILLDEPWNEGTEDQWTDRAHRIGTKFNVTVRRLICKNTIDEKVRKIVKSKGLTADVAVDGLPLDLMEKLILDDDF